MRVILLQICTPVLLLTGCVDNNITQRNIPPAHIGPVTPAPSLRHTNWSPYGEGSCVWASLATTLQWQRQNALAKYVRQNYHSGSDANRLINACNRLNLPIQYTKNGDPAFLEYVHANRLSAVIFYYDKHCVNFLGYRDGYAVLLDNNSVHKFNFVPKSEFLSNWRNFYSGFALTVTLNPYPPTPRQ